MWMVINNNIKESKMRRKFKMHENGKKWDAGGCKNKIKRGWALNSSWGAGLGLRNGSGLDWVWVMGSIYKGCEGEIPHFSLVFLSLPFPNENALSSLIFFSDGEGWSEVVAARWPTTVGGGAAAKTISFFWFFFSFLILFSSSIFSYPQNIQSINIQA